MSLHAPVAGAMSASFPAAGPMSTSRPDAWPFVGSAGNSLSAAATAPAMRMLWQNTSTGDRSIWLMNGTSWDGSYVALPQVPTAWSIAGSGDFNADGQADIVWQNTVTGDRSIWFMNGNNVSSYALLPQVPTQWSIAGVGDFNGDGSPDLVWQNTTTGDRSIWFMNGSTWNGSYALLPQVATAWSIAAVADFNADGKPDLVWQNTTTGERSIWFMNGAQLVSYALLPTVPAQWRIVAAADFDGDAKPDLVWQNITTGERSIWLMNGASWGGSYALLPTVPTQWSIAAVMPGTASPCSIQTAYTIGTTSNGALTTSDCQLADGSFIDFYSTTVSSANAYLFAESSTAFDTYLVLTAPDLTPIAENDDASTSTTNSKIKVLLPSGGYVLGAGSFDPGVTGNYGLSSAVTAVDIANCEEAFIVRGITTTQNVQSTDCVDSAGPFYGDQLIIYLKAGQSLTVSMSSTAFDSYLELRDGNGTLVAANDDANGTTLNAQLTYTASTAGYYAIFATTALASAFGSYTLTVQ